MRARANGREMSVPFGIATTIQQKVLNKAVSFQGFEQVNELELSNTTASGTSVEIPMNPFNLAGTRLQNMAKNFTKYRFRRMKIVIQGTLPTSVGGALNVAYSENPDYQLTSGSENQDVFALDGCISKNLWSNLEVSARIRDRSKW